MLRPFCTADEADLRFFYEEEGETGTTLLKSCDHIVHACTLCTLHLHTHGSSQKQTAANVSIQTALVNNAVLKVAARRELEGKQVDVPPSPTYTHTLSHTRTEPVRQRSTVPCQVSDAVLTPQVLSCCSPGPWGAALFFSRHIQSSDGQ